MKKTMPIFAFGMIFIKKKISAKRSSRFLKVRCYQKNCLWLTT